MQNFQDTLGTRKRSSNNTFYICMTVPLKYSGYIKVILWMARAMRAQIDV